MKNLIDWLFPTFDIQTPDGKVYLRRRDLARLFGFKLMLHHIRLADCSRDIHDHPWWFFTLVLWGGYTEKTFEGNRERKPGRLYFNGIHFAHVITRVPDRGAWTLVLRGSRRREWGFFTRCGWMHWTEYTHRYYNGLPICEDDQPAKPSGRAS